MISYVHIRITRSGEMTSSPYRLQPDSEVITAERARDEQEQFKAKMSVLFTEVYDLLLQDLIKEMISSSIYSSINVTHQTLIDDMGQVFVRHPCLTSLFETHCMSTNPQIGFLTHDATVELTKRYKERGFDVKHYGSIEGYLIVEW